MNKYKCPECNSISGEDEWNKTVIIEIQNARPDTNFTCPSCEWFGNRKNIVQQKEYKTDISSESKFKVGDEVIFETDRITLNDYLSLPNKGNTAGRIRIVMNGLYDIDVVDSLHIVRNVPEGDIKLKDDKMQVLSAVNKWKNGDFVVFSGNSDKSKKFLEYVGVKDYYHLSSYCYQWVIDHCTYASKEYYYDRGIDVISFEEFEEMLNHDKIGILSCVEFDVKSWKRREFAVECNTKDNFEKFFEKTEINKAKHIEFIEAFPCIMYGQDNRDDWSRFGDSNRVEINTIDFKYLKFTKDDKKKILSEEKANNFIKQCGDASKFTTKYRLFPDEEFKRDILGTWNFSDNSVFQIDSSNTKGLIKMNRHVDYNFDFLSDLKPLIFKDYSNPWLIGADFAKEYPSEWIGKGEKNMKTETIFRELGIKSVKIDEENKLVLMEDNNNQTTAGKLKNNEFDFKSAFALAYFNLEQPNLYNVNIDEKNKEVTLSSSQYGSTSTVKTTERDTFNPVVGQALAYLESRVGVSKTKLKKWLSEVEKEVLIKQKEDELYSEGNLLKKQIDKKAESERVKVNKNIKKSLEDFKNSLNEDK